jgi:hypothetical protein
MKMAQTMDAVVGRLTYDQDFAAALANNPREAFENAGLLMAREGVEVLMAIDPERFDRACEALFNLVDSDFLHKLVMPSCGMRNVEPPSARAESLEAVRS